jgi:hypothetical protein
MRNAPAKAAVTFLMTRQAMRELAAILRREHGHATVAFAEVRRNEHSRRSEGYSLWNAFVVELQRHRLTRENGDPGNRRACDAG